MTLVFSLLVIFTLVMSGDGSSSSSGMPETPVMPEGGDDDGEGTGIETMLTEDEQAAAAMRIAMAIGPDSIRPAPILYFSREPPFCFNKQVKTIWYHRYGRNITIQGKLPSFVCVYQSWFT